MDNTFLDDEIIGLTEEIAPTTLSPRPQQLPLSQIVVPAMDFPDAIREVIKGNKITRLSWDTSESYGLFKDDYLTIFIRGEFHLWNVNSGDLEGKDWVVIK